MLPDDKDLGQSARECCCPYLLQACTAAVWTHLSSLQVLKAEMAESPPVECMHPGFVMERQGTHCLLSCCTKTL